MYKHSNDVNYIDLIDVNMKDLCKEKTFHGVFSLFCSYHECPKYSPPLVIERHKQTGLQMEC